MEMRREGGGEGEGGGGGGRGITRGLIRNTVLGIDRLFADALHFSVCTFCSFFIFFPSFILYHYLD